MNTIRREVVIVSRLLEGYSVLQTFLATIDSSDDVQTIMITCYVYVSNRYIFPVFCRQLHSVASTVPLIDLCYGSTDNSLI